MKLLAVLLTVLCLVALSQALALVRNRRGVLTDEADRLIRQGATVNTNDVGQLADLVARYGSEDCLARVICELTQNPQSNGPAGNKFGQSLMRFRQSKHPKAKRYVDAMTFGAKAKGPSECRNQFSHCAYPNQEIVAVGNKILH